MPDEQKSENAPKCPICGGTNTEIIGKAENAYGEFVNECVCKDCDIDFEEK